MFHKFLLTFFILFLSSTSFGFKLSNLKKLSPWKNDLVKYQKQVRRACGVPIPMLVSPATALPFSAQNKQASRYCREILEGIVEVCKMDKEYKAYVPQKIKSVKCLLHKNPKGVSFELEGTVLNARIGTKSANIWKKSRDWVEENL